MAYQLILGSLFGALSNEAVYLFFHGMLTNK